MNATPPLPARSAPAPLQAILWGGGTIVLFLSARPVLSFFGLVGNTVLQWGFLFAPVVAVLLLSGSTLRDGVGLRGVSPRVLLGGSLVMLGALPINGVVAWLQSLVVPVPVEALERMAEAFVATSPLQWVLILVAGALTPAFCEEIVFRGILMHPFRGRVPGWAVIAATSLAFGMLHWTPSTAFRILPAAVSGAAIGWMVWTTGSLWTGIVMHFVNNSILLTAAAFAPTALPEDPSLAPNPAGVGVGIVLLVLGSRLASRPRGWRGEPADGTFGEDGG